MSPRVLLDFMIYQGINHLNFQTLGNFSKVKHYGYVILIPQKQF